MNDRTCIVTGKAGAPETMIRFVQGPDGVVVPDLRGNLPGRGCRVTATREAVEKAVAKNHFRRGLKADVRVDKGLPDLLDTLLVRQVTGALAMARKAGDVVSGHAQVDKAVRAGKALAVVHAAEAADDGVRKIDQARRATALLGGPDTASYRLLTAEQIGLAFGNGHVIHAAVLDGRAGDAALRRLEALAHYRGLSGHGHG